MTTTVNSLISTVNGKPIIDKDGALELFQIERDRLIDDKVISRARLYVDQVNALLAMDLVTYRLSIGTLGVHSPNTPFASWLVGKVKEEIFDNMSTVELERLYKEAERRARMIAL